MSVKDSHLTIREDLIEEGLSVPVWFLDYKEDTHVEDPVEDIRDDDSPEKSKYEPIRNLG